jgi:hypothetical protein
LAVAVIVSVRQQGGQVDLVGLARAVAAGVSLPVVGDAVGIVDQGRPGAAGNGEFSGPDEAVAAPAAGQDVVAPTAGQRVVAPAANQDIADGAADQRVGAIAGDRRLDGRAEGDRDVVDESSGAAERAGHQAHRRCLGEAGEIERVVMSLVVDRDDRGGVGGEVVELPEVAGDGRIEAEHVVAVEGRCPGLAVQALDGDDIERHRRMRRLTGDRPSDVVVIEAPIGALVVVAGGELRVRCEVPVDIRHDRPHPLVVRAELLRRHVGSAVVEPRMSEPEQMANLVDDGAHSVAAEHVERSRQIEARPCGVETYDVLAQALAEIAARCPRWTLRPRRLRCPRRRESA